MVKSAPSQCHCPHCGTAYPLVAQIMGRPVRCRQCRHVFLVDDQGQVRPVITNRLPKESPETDNGDQQAFAPAAAQATAGDDALDVSPALQRKPRPATQRIQALDVKNQQQAQRSTSRIMASAGPRSLDPRIQQAAGQQKTATQESAQDASRIYRADEQVLDVPSTSLEKKRTRPSQVFRKRNSTEAILGAMRAGMLAKKSASSESKRLGGMSPSIAAAVQSQAAPAEDDVGDESTNTALAAIPQSRSDPVVHCPHCGETYPFNESLLNRAVRCRRCHGVFRVFADHSSEPVIANRAVPPRHNLDDKAIKKPYVARSHTQVVRNQELVSAMSRSMADAMQQAAARSAPTTATPRSAAQASPKHIIPTISNDRAEQRRATWMWLSTLVVVAVLITGLGLVMFQATPQEQALRAFNATDTGERMPQQRIATMRERAWKSTAAVQPILGLRRADIAATRRYILPDLSQLRSLLASMQPLADYPLWVSTEDYEQAQELLQPNSSTGTDSPVQAVEALLQEHFEVVSMDHLQAMIDALPTHNEVRMVLSSLLADPHSPAAMAVLQQPPDFFELARFRGDNGRLLLANGDLRRSSYQGLLLRALGDADIWDGTWRVFTLRADGLANHLPPRP